MQLGYRCNCDNYTFITGSLREDRKIQFLLKSPGHVNTYPTVIFLMDNKQSNQEMLCSIFSIYPTHNLLR